MTSSPLYLTYDESVLSEESKAQFGKILTQYGFSGTEVYMNHFHPRSELIFTDGSSKQAALARLRAMQVQRIHCSYWGYPTSFLTKSHFAELVERAQGLDSIRDYYGDLSGRHLYERWAQEYELACLLKAPAYVFHVIDYAFVDGAWPFTISREEIRQAMVQMVQNFLMVLEEKGLVGVDSPVIELENAGWGLEYGLQTAEDFAFLFEQLYDRHERVRIGWDINHLLHALGKRPTGEAGFLLSEPELTPVMEKLTAEQTDPQSLAIEWLKHNLLHPAVAKKISALHLSDCALKTEEYFTNGRLNGRYAEEIDKRGSRTEKSDYGVSIVLDYYDSHLPLGSGLLEATSFQALVSAVVENNPDVSFLHELKNSRDLQKDLALQMAFLSQGRVHAL